MLNDFTSLLQWNRSIYSPNEQNRVENVLPFLREQITTTDSYISHVSQVKDFFKKKFLLEFKSYIAINGIGSKFTIVGKIYFILYEYNSID